MNPVNATTLYVSACRSVLQCDPRDPQALAELYKLLPFFRQSLSCLACGKNSFVFDRNFIFQMCLALASLLVSL